MNIEIKRYPYNSDCAFLVGLDDLHPEGIADKEGLDFGKDFNGKFWRRIDALLKEVPEIKITVFTPADWIDRSNFPSGLFWPLRKIYSKRRSYDQGFHLNNETNRKWVSSLKQKMKGENIFLSYHGLNHHNGNKKYAASQEFNGLSKEETEMKLDFMLKIVNKSGLNFEKGFRSPGWGTSSALNNFLKEKKFLYTANSTDFNSKDVDDVARGTGVKGQKISGVTNNGIINITANCYPHQTDRAVEIARNKGVIVVHAHVAKTIFGIKYVDSKFVENIKKMTAEIRNQTLAHVWFASFSELAKFVKVRDEITIEVEDGILKIHNPTEEDINGLTIVFNNVSRVIGEIRSKQTFELDTKKQIKEGLVSIILTVYNGEHQVVDSLKSLCNQSYSNIEIIVVNDGSTDNTKNILEKYIRENHDNRVKILNQPNGGRSNARNNGFKKSTGSIITFCEDDAFYDRDYILNAVKHFGKNDKKLAGVIGPHYVWNKKESINTRVKDVERRRNFYNYKPQATWFYRRDLFENIGMFDESLELVEDVAPAILLKKKGYHFDFEPEARWLHKEPANIKNYLRRKFRGGVGMALLQKKKLRKSIVPPVYLAILTFLFVISLTIAILKPVILLLLMPLFILFLFLLRLPTFIISKQVSDESPWFLVFAILYEYIWWISTFLGYIKGIAMSEREILSYLKGR